MLNIASQQLLTNFFSVKIISMSNHKRDLIWGLWHNGISKTVDHYDWRNHGRQRINKHWIIALRGNTGLGFCKTPATMSSLTGQYVTLCDVCFCIKTPYWIHIVIVLTANMQPMAQNSSCLNEASPAHIFSMTHTPAFLPLETPHST